MFIFSSSYFQIGEEKVIKRKVVIYNCNISLIDESPINTGLFPTRESCHTL
jgi:hypothetical protein